MKSYRHYPPATLAICAPSSLSKELGTDCGFLIGILYASVIHLSGLRTRSYSFARQRADSRILAQRNAYSSVKASSIVELSSQTLASAACIIEEILLHLRIVPSAWCTSRRRFNNRQLHFSLLLFERFQQLFDSLSSRNSIQTMAGKFLQGAVSRGLREAGAVLREEGGIEVRCPFVRHPCFAFAFSPSIFRVVVKA